MERTRRLLPIVTFAALAIACGDYSGGSSNQGGGQIVVVAGGVPGLNSGEQVTAFASSVYPLLAENCAECHSGSGPGTPHIASPNPAVAFSAVVDNQKVNFTLPESSRLVRRLATDFHYCWTSCIENGAEMLAAVMAWGVLLEEAGVEGGGAGIDVETLVSDTIELCDGIGDESDSCSLDEGDERYEEHVIALYEFKEDGGSIAFDTSGVAPAADLTLNADAEFMSSYGIDITAGGLAVADETSSRKLYERIADPANGSGEYSIEVWAIPGNTTQSGDSGPSRIVTYSRGSGNVNFNVGQNLYQYVFRNRSVAEGVNGRGAPELITYAADEDLQDTLQHVVFTFDRFSGRRIYVNGVWTDDVDEQPTARLWNWDDRGRIGVGNEVAGTGNEWFGKVRFLAIYDRALDSAQVRQNYLAGVGKRLTLTFDVSEWAGAGTVVDFSVTQLDDYSYLFCQPTFRGPNTAGLSVENIRIQVNGTVPVQGQAFSNVDQVLLADGQQVSRLCSIIRSELGPDADNFTIVFEQLGRFQSPVDVSLPSFEVSTAVLDPVPVAGIRDFGRVNETMVALTDVDPRTPGVLDAYLELTQQLPSSSDIRTFVSSHQVGISKLAFEYCHEMVEGDTGLRDAFFGTGFQWTAAATIAFDSDAKLDLITEPLIQKMVRYGMPAQELTDQADSALVEADLDLLIMELMVCNPPACTADRRTVDIVKGVCTAVLASAAVMVH